MHHGELPGLLNVVEELAKQYRLDQKGKFGLEFEKSSVENDRYLASIPGSSSFLFSFSKAEMSEYFLNWNPTLPELICFKNSLRRIVQTSGYGDWNLYYTKIGRAHAVVLRETVSLLIRL